MVKNGQHLGSAPNDTNWTDLQYYVSNWCMLGFDKNAKCKTTHIGCSSCDFCFCYIVCKCLLQVRCEAFLLFQTIPVTVVTVEPHSAQNIWKLWGARWSRQTERSGYNMGWVVKQRRWTTCGMFGHSLFTGFKEWYSGSNRWGKPLPILYCLFLYV